MRRIGIIAALPGELKPLVAGWKRQSVVGSSAAGGPPLPLGVRLWRHRQGESEWIAACAGAGIEAARRAFAVVEAEGPLDAVISAGWAGALREGFSGGEAYQMSGALDAQTGEAFPTDSVSGKGWVATSHEVAHSADKRKLAAATQADLVDMEAVAVARLAAARRIPFYCVKGVSDEVSDRLPDFNRFIGPNGQFHLIRFIGFAALRPWWWPALIRLGRQSAEAARGLNLRLREILEGQKSDYD